MPGSRTCPTISVRTVVGAASVAIFLELTAYYHAILIALACLWPRRPAVGAGLLALAALSWVPYQAGLLTDEILRWTNLATVALVVGATLTLLRADPDDD